MANRDEARAAKKSMQTWLKNNGISAQTGLGGLVDDANIIVRPKHPLPEGTEIPETWEGVPIQVGDAPKNVRKQAA